MQLYNLIFELKTHVILLIYRIVMRNFQLFKGWEMNFSETHMKLLLWHTLSIKILDPPLTSLTATTMAALLRSLPGGGEAVV